MSAPTELSDRRRNVMSAETLRSHQHQNRIAKELGRRFSFLTPRGKKALTCEAWHVSRKGLEPKVVGLPLLATFPATLPRLRQVR